MRPAGTAERSMKNTVFVPVGILVPTPWDSRPRSFASLVFQKLVNDILVNDCEVNDQVVND